MTVNRSKFIRMMACMCSLIVRLGPALYVATFQDKHMEVKFTDVDFSVFRDASQMIRQNRSPYDRDTYRYTPLIAELFSLFSNDYQVKLLLSAVDMALLILVTRHIRSAAFKASVILNPFTMVIAQRGNADCLVCLAVVLSLLAIQRGWIITAGACLGMAVHLKLYPVIYALPFLLYMCRHLTFESKLADFAKVAFRVLRFFSACMLVVGAMTLYYYTKFGHDFLHNAYLYHFTRVDVRHNLSPFFYVSYLTAEWDFNPFFLLTLVQVYCMLVTNYWLRDELQLNMFTQTVLFVILNRVCTSQYYTWFLYLLPLLEIDNLRMTKYEATLLLGKWLTAQVLWMIPAYLLEFKGRSSFVWIWISSLFLLAVHFHILISIISSSRRTAVSSCKVR